MSIICMLMKIPTFAIINIAPESGFEQGVGLRAWAGGLEAGLLHSAEF